MNRMMMVAFGHALMDLNITEHMVITQTCTSDTEIIVWVEHYNDDGEVIKTTQHRLAITLIQ